MSRALPRHWAQMGETTFVAGIWLLYWVHRLTGRGFFRLCLAPVVLVYWLSRPPLRAASLQYLRRMHAAQAVFERPPGRRQSRRHVALFAETMLDKLLAMAGRFPVERVVRHGRINVTRAVQGGQGGIIVTAHIGCLELCRTMADSQARMKLNVLVHTRHAQSFNRLLQRLNPETAITLIEVTELSAASAVLLAEKVAAGEFVAIAGDRVPVSQEAPGRPKPHGSPGGRGHKTVTVDFLGHAAQFPVGPYVLASLLKCPLYLMGCIHEGRGYGIYFECLSEAVKLPRAAREAALQAHAQAYADALTRLLRRSPYDWFNFFPFWDQACEPKL